jgi:hypothetical protein
MVSLNPSSIDLSDPNVLALPVADLIREHARVAKSWELQTDHLPHTTPYEKDSAVIRRVLELAGLPRQKRYVLTTTVSYWTAVYFNVTYAHVAEVASILAARTSEETTFNVDEIPGVSVPWLKSRQDKPIRIAIDGKDVGNVIEDWSDDFVISEAQIWSFGLRKLVLTHYGDDPRFAGVASLYRRDCKALEQAIDKRIGDMTKRIPRRARHYRREIEATAMAAELSALCRDSGGPVPLSLIGTAVYDHNMTEAEQKMLKRGLLQIRGIELSGSTKDRMYFLRGDLDKK